MGEASPASLSLARRGREKVGRVGQKREKMAEGIPAGDRLDCIAARAPCEYPDGQQRGAGRMISVREAKLFVGRSCGC